MDAFLKTHKDLMDASCDNGWFNFEKEDGKDCFGNEFTSCYSHIASNFESNNIEYKDEYIIKYLTTDANWEGMETNLDFNAFNKRI